MSLKGSATLRTNTSRYAHGTAFTRVVGASGNIGLSGADAESLHMAHGERFRRNLCMLA